MESELKKPQPSASWGNPQNRVSMVRDNPYSGNVILAFFNDGIEVRADFIPPTGAGEPVAWPLVRSFLEGQRIVYGIQESIIQNAIADCASAKSPVTNVLVAQGDPPVPEILAYFEINHQLFSGPQSTKPHERIDYRARSPFIIVKKDQTLASKRPGTPGCVGRNVYGDFIPYKTLKPEGVTGGEHTRTGDTYISAEINGQFVQDKNVLRVQDSLVIKGGVGYATGHIAFPGDVIIEGPVSDGFKIYAGGSVTIKQTFDVTEATARGNLSVAGGIIGRGRGVAKVRGQIKTKFIENCHVACLKTVTVERAIINSTVFAMETIDLGNKGFIIGGDMTAVHGVRAGNIGKEGGKSTKLHCGIDFIVQQQLETANGQLQLLTVKAEKIHCLLRRPDITQDKRLALDKLLKNIQEEQGKLRERIISLLERTNADESAIVEAYGEIAPGTLVEICQVALFVFQPLRKVRIKLDRFSGKLITEPLGKG